MQKGYGMFIIAFFYWLIMCNVYDIFYLYLYRKNCMKLSVFWTGYVGLVTWTCLAEAGHDVVCVDIDQEKIDNLEKWIIPIYEPWLEEIVLTNQKALRLNFTTDAKEAIEHAEVVFNAVWTPPDENWRADLQYVHKVAETFATHLNGYKVFVNKSTVPVKTGEACHEQIKNILSETWNEQDFSVVSNPEFLREWTALNDFMHPERIVCGVSDDRAHSYMEEVYQSFTEKGHPLIFTDLASAEMAKYAANTYLATRISFVNELANFAEEVWANISDITQIMWMDTRIWPKFLRPWIWYGGSCFPKDVEALVKIWKDNGHDLKIISGAEEVNNAQKHIPVQKLYRHLEVKNASIAVRWVAFKPNTDDVRAAPSHTVFDDLLTAGVKEIRVYDPIAMEEMEKAYGTHDKIIYMKNKEEACEDADALLLLTEWQEFVDTDEEYIKWKLAWNIVIDWRNIWSRKNAESAWLIYEWIGT